MKILLTPPLTFILSLIAVILFGKLFKSFEYKGTPNPEKTKTYACGEDFPAEKVIPSYEEFYPYAIFFTILHVAALMIMTLAFSGGISFAVPFVFLAIIIVILSILFVI